MQLLVPVASSSDEKRNYFMETSGWNDSDETTTHLLVGEADDARQEEEHERRPGVAVRLGLERDVVLEGLDAQVGQLGGHQGPLGRAALVGVQPEEDAQRARQTLPA